MYRTIGAELWTDPRVRKLPPLAKLVFLYLITNPQSHVGGIYWLPSMMINHATGLDQPTVDTLCHTLSDLGLARFDPENEVVWVVNMFRHQARGSKVDASVTKHLESLHNSKLIKEFCDKYPQITPPPVDTPSIGHLTGTGTGTGTGTVEGTDTVSGTGSETPCAPKGESSHEVAPRAAAPSQTAKPRKQPTATLQDPPVPESLDTPAFRERWAAWLDFRANAKRKPVSRHAALEQFSELAQWGADAACLSISKSIANDWQGLFQPDKAKTGGGFGVHPHNDSKKYTQGSDHAF